MKVYRYDDEQGWMEIADCVNEYVAEKTTTMWAVLNIEEWFGYGDNEDSVTRVVIGYETR